MKNKIVIVAILLIMAYLVGCTNAMNTKEGGETISAPTVKNLDINGSWKIINYYIMDSNIGDENEAKTLINKIGSFNSELAAIGKNYLANPKYKLKVVVLGNFLYNEYKWTVNSNITDKNVEVTSVSDDNNVFCDFIKLDDKNGFLAYKGILYTLVKSGDSTLYQWQVGSDLKAQSSSESINKNYNDPVGVLIGLKSPREKLANGQYGPATYKTMWISFDGEKIGDTKVAQTLLVPRMKGFWDINVSHIEIGGVINEALTVGEIKNEKGALSRTVSKGAYDYSLYRDISFVGNDYISTQYYKGNQFKNTYNEYQILPVDNIRPSKGIDINTLLGEEAQKSFYIAWSNQVINLTSDAKEKLNVANPNYENFAMARKNGHWILQGKISAKDQDNFNGISFNINYPPTKKLVNYDKLLVPWNSIKEIVPSALDAYTSSTGRLVFIITKDKINIYEIKNGTIVANFIRSIDLKNGESVVMCEWVETSKDVARWSKIVDSVISSEQKSQ